MRLDELERIFRALQDAGVRYLVAGGVAVNAHGYRRLTHDLDLALDLERENVQKALDALGELGYAPVLPVPARAFADPEVREQWNRERNMEVFSLVTDAGPDVTIDLFVRAPFPFDEERDRALVAEIAPGLEVPIVSLQTLIAMKRATGRERDRNDVEHLEWIRSRMRSGD